MTGKYGTIVEYIRAYERYGGKPPVPEDAPVRRGQARSRKSHALGMGLALTAFVAMFVLGATAGSSGPLPTGVWMFIAGAVAVLLDVGVINPIQDWYDDTPRYGLESIDREYGVLSTSAGGLE